MQEYLVWQVYDRRLVWWELREGAYVPLEADERGWLCSRVFPGLWLDTPALLHGKLAAVLTALQQGTARSTAPFSSGSPRACDCESPHPML